MPKHTAVNRCTELQKEEDSQGYDVSVQIDPKSPKRIGKRIGTAVLNKEE